MADLFLSMGAFGTLFMLFVAILWIALPFAVFGIKARLDEQTSVMKKILVELQKQRSNDKPKAPETSKPEPTHFESDGNGSSIKKGTEELEPPVDLYDDPAKNWFKKK